MERSQNEISKTESELPIFVEPKEGSSAGDGSILLFLFFLGFGFAASGQIVDGATPVRFTEKGAGCTPPSTTTYMELNNVRAMIHTAGNLWQVPGQNFSQYEVPKNSGIMALFTAALWLGGTDVNNQLKLAALRYRNGQD